MRQVVVLEPAGSVLVIRQTSLGPSGVTSVTTTTNPSLGGTNHHNGHDSHAISNGSVSNDHNQNRIVVVRSSSTTCMTSTLDNGLLINNNGNLKNNGNITINGNNVINVKSCDIVSNAKQQTDRGDHRKVQDTGGGGGGDVNSINRQKSTKEIASHEHHQQQHQHGGGVTDGKTDGADTISGECLSQFPVFHSDKSHP
ncbi:hypothetical protein PV325_006934 [Microctonus aethiopoides]|nr:hypothetical protein PV325_006934 [Microctonus aethiopoides]KAK0091985.1 hypothetical protein PV326_002409 [Microctonus aethiopoides]